MSGFEAFFAGLGSTGAAGAGTAAAAGAGTAAAAGAGTAAAAGTSWATYAAAAASVLAANAQIQEGKAAQRAAEMNIDLAKAEAASKERLQRDRARRMISETRASIGKSGATTAGTPLMVLADSAAEAEIDALNTRWGANTQSNIYRATGRNARKASTARAGASLLTGFGQIA